MRCEHAVPIEASSELLLRHGRMTEPPAAPPENRRTWATGCTAPTACGVWHAPAVRAGARQTRRQSRRRSA
eukprot:5248439-Prymnesium_polylepis.1